MSTVQQLRQRRDGEIAKAERACADTTKQLRREIAETETDRRLAVEKANADFEATLAARDRELSAKHRPVLATIFAELFDVPSRDAARRLHEAWQTMKAEYDSQVGEDIAGNVVVECGAVALLSECPTLAAVCGSTHGANYLVETCGAIQQRLADPTCNAPALLMAVDEFEARLRDAATMQVRDDWSGDSKAERSQFPEAFAIQCSRLSERRRNADRKAAFPRVLHGAWRQPPPETKPIKVTFVEIGGDDGGERVIQTRTFDGNAEALPMTR